MSIQAAALVVAWIAILLLSLTLAGVVRQLHSLRDEGTSHGNLGLPRGVKAPPTAALPASDKPSVLLFASGGCRSCGEALPGLARFARASDSTVTFSVVTRGDRIDHTLPPQVKVTVDARAFEEFRIPYVPVAVGIDAGGRVVDTKAVGSAELIDEFLESFSSRMRGEDQWH